MGVELENSATSRNQESTFLMQNFCFWPWEASHQGSADTEESNVTRAHIHSPVTHPTLLSAHFMLPPNQKE